MSEQFSRDVEHTSVDRRKLFKYSLAGAAGMRGLLTAAGTSALLGAAGVSRANAQSTQLIVGMQGAAGTLDARRVRAIPEQQLFFALYDGLVDFDQDATIRPRLAESFERLDATSWRFKLRQGVKFHDGEDFTAESVAFTFDQFKSLDPPFYYVNIWGPAWPPDVEIEADDSVIIRTPNPSPLLPNFLTRVGMLPTAAENPDFGESPIGTGPFKFSSWAKGDSVTLETNTDYWDGAPEIGGLVVRTIPEPASQLAALQSGEIHIAFEPPVDQLDVLAPPDLGKLEARSTGLAQVLLNYRNPDSPIADVNVRTALKLAVDGEGMIGALLAGVAEAGIGPAPASCFGALDAGGYPARDVEQAISLLAEAGYQDGLDLTMIFTEGEFPRDTVIAEALISQLREIGANVELVQLDPGQYAERRNTADWDIATNGTTGWTADAEYYINDVKTTLGYQSDELDALVLEAAAADDEDQRVELLHQAQQILWDDVPYLWSFDVVLVLGVSSKISGVDLIPTSWILARDASISG